MKKLCLVLGLVILLSGCATYKIQPDKDGFAVSRYKKIIPEYTQGIDRSFPDKEVAQERFKRRRKKVEYYYKKMGFIDNRFKQVFVEPSVAFIQFVTGIFRVPFIAISDYKYNHNPQYREKIDKLEDEEYEAEKSRIKNLKQELSVYIKEDLEKEPSLSESQKTASKEKAKVAKPVEDSTMGTEPALKEGLKSEPIAVEPAVAILKEEVKPRPAIKEVEFKEIKPTPVILSSPRAVIIAKPHNGPSPLKVNFYGNKSKSPNGRIISYVWDFGDGDKSTKPNPSNTFWSTTYGIREFTVTLTVIDSKGVASFTSTTIQVVNK